MKDFVHLHLHTEYSMLDGAVKINELAEKVSTFGPQNQACGITDHGNLFGMIEFYQTMESKGIKPILGLEAYVAPEGISVKKQRRDEQKKRAYHLCLFASDMQGYKNISKLSTISHLEGFYYKPRIDRELIEKYHEGLIASTACLAGEIPQLILQGQYEKAKETAGFYNELFGKGNFYLELQYHGIPDQKIVNQALIRMSRELDIPLIAANDSHYLEKEHAESHELLIMIQTGKTKEEVQKDKEMGKKVFEFATDEFYVKTPEEMWKIFGEEIPEALTNTLEVAEKCSLNFKFGNFRLPNFDFPKEYTNASEFLRVKTFEGLKEKFNEITPEIKERADSELKIIDNMGFPGYFLIVSDFCLEAKRKGVLVGPGRGSATGSLVSYAIGITDVDPLEYGLIFERFLNPERVSMPDIDIDFADYRRDEVIDYVKQKYGADKVSQVVTFMKMKAKQVVKDVGRVLGLGFQEMNAFSKLIPDGPKVTIDKALEESEELKRSVEENEIYKEIIKHSRVLEGICRQTGAHAAGILIAPEPIDEMIPLYKAPDRDEILSQFSKDYVEDMGLIKMDFLGLTTLTIIEKTLFRIKKRRNENIKFDVNGFDLNDTKTYRLFSKGKTNGIFQFESKGMQENLKKLKPNNINDLIAMNALYRPGPMGFIENYIARKHGKEKVEYDHELIKSILKETFGIIVYQEQVMAIARKLADYTMGEADQLRRAMGKKKIAEMDKHKDKFLKKAKEKKIDEKIAIEIFDKMAEFSKYGFNKSHSAGYSLLAYVTGYLKAHYPEEFMASLLTANLKNQSKIKLYIEEAASLGIKILPPDVNESFEDFTAPQGKNKLLRFGLGSVKNLGSKTIESIIECRQKEGSFKNIFDFVRRIDRSTLNRKGLESLIKSGALDSLSHSRSELFESIDIILDYAAKKEKSKNIKGMTLFDIAGVDEKDQVPSLKKVPEWGLKKILEDEIDITGFYISGHPLDLYEFLLPNIINFTLDKELEKEKVYRIAGIVRQVARKQTKKGDDMAIIVIEDKEGTAEIPIFSKDFEKYRTCLYKGNILYIVAETTNYGDIRLKPRDIIPIEEVVERYKLALRIIIDNKRFKEDKTEKIEEFFKEHPGDTPVHFIYRNGNEMLEFKSNKYRVNSANKNIKKLSRILGGKKNILFTRIN